MTPVDATRHNGPLLALLRKQGRTRPLGLADFLQLYGSAGNVQLKPTSTSYYADGGILNKGGTPGGQASAESIVSLRAEQQRTNALLAQLVGTTEATASNTATVAEHAATTAQTNALLVSYGPPRLAIGHWEAMQIEEARQEALDSMAMLTLGAS